MKTAGIVIDSWKLDIFKKFLDEAGFNYTEHPGVVKLTTILKVDYELSDDLQSIVENANSECRYVKGRLH